MFLSFSQQATIETYHEKFEWLLLILILLPNSRYLLLHFQGCNLRADSSQAFSSKMSPDEIKDIYLQKQPRRGVP